MRKKSRKPLLLSFLSDGLIFPTASSVFTVFNARQHLQIRGGSGRDGTFMSMSCHVVNKDSSASPSAPLAPLPVAAGSSGSMPIPIVVTGCVQQSDADAEESTSGGSEAAFSIPTVSIEVETSEEDLSKRWYVPTSTSDFDLPWVQFVMQQYYTNTTEDKHQKIPIVKKFTVNMAGSPEDEKASKGYGFHHHH